MRLSSHIVSILASAVFSLAAGFASAAPEDSPWGRDYFTNVEVVPHDGAPARFYDDLVEDRIVVINFIYTRCVDICPLTTGRMAEIVEKLGDRVGKDIHVYSITLEPEYDTPEVLASFADAFDAPEGWRFVTGDPAIIHPLRFKLGERARIKEAHRHDLLLGNDRTGEWERTSMFSDVDILVDRILAMDPAWRAIERDTISASLPSNQLLKINHPGESLFAKACAACHNIGDGDKVGPDLVGLSERRDRAWLQEFLLQPEVVLATGDPIAMQLDARFPNARMPNLGLSMSDIEDLLAYIDFRTEE